MRLPATVLALRAFFLNHDRWPQDLSELPHVPRDPFNKSCGPLQYRIQGDKMLLYSVGVDGMDDGGTPENEDTPLMEASANGDLRLEQPETDDETTIDEEDLSERDQYIEPVDPSQEIPYE